MGSPESRQDKRDRPSSGGSPGSRPESQKRRVLLMVGGSFEYWWSHAQALRDAGIEVQPAVRDRLAALGRGAVAVVLVDLSTDLEDGLRTVAHCRTALPEVPVVVAASRPSLLLARRLRSARVFHLALHPIDSAELLLVLDDAFAFSAGEHAVPTSRRTKTVLIIDDDADFVRSTEALLLTEGYLVVSASTAREGLLRVVSERPDLIVLDIMMETPWAGYEVNQAIKLEPSFEGVREVPILMVSSVRTPPEELFELAWDTPPVCPDSFLTKPLAIEGFITRVRELLKQSAG